MSGSPYMIECRDLTKVYYSGETETPALRGINLQIKTGEYVAIMGHSGSGKSTLMHILGALDTPTEGVYYLEGIDISTLDDDELAEIRADRIGFVFQAFNLLPRTTVLRNVMLPLLYTDVPADEREELAEDALIAAGLDEERWDHRSNQLSGGEIQRVAIARALVNHPALILADEPTGNLDTQTGEHILATFASLHEQGHTIILITHEADVAAHAQRTIILRDGLMICDTVSGDSCEGTAGEAASSETDAGREPVPAAAVTAPAGPEVAA
jgi:putative ABC transport system ATP-binding protein